MIAQGSVSYGSEGAVTAMQHLLQRQEYDTAAQVAASSRMRAETAGDHRLAGLLATIHQICLVCQQQQEQISLHYRTYETAVQREQLLRQQLEGLVKLLPSADTAVPLRLPFPEPVPAAPAAHNAPVRATTEAQLMVYTFGPFRVYEHGRLLDDWTSHKAKAIFKYMLQHRDRPLHREELMAQFWPDDDPNAARRNLYQAIYMLRQTLQAGSNTDYVLNGDGRYRLNPDIIIWIDSDAFHQYYQNGQRLEASGNIAAAIQQYEAADALYEDDYLIEDLYEEWALSPRENYKLAYLDLLDRLSQHYWETNNDAMCIIVCRQILQQDNCREDAHRRLMRVYMRRGQRHLALRQYHQCVAALMDELGVEPMPTTIELHQHIMGHAQKVTG